MAAVQEAADLILHQVAVTAATTSRRMQLVDSNFHAFAVEDVEAVKRQRVEYKRCKLEVAGAQIASSRAAARATLARQRLLAGATWEPNGATLLNMVINTPKMKTNKK